MCENLRILARPSALHSSCLENGSQSIYRQRFGINKPYFYNVSILPCGKCIECLKKKQDSFVVRIQEEAKKRGSMAFVTLTYREECLPLAMSLWRVDKETGELSLEQTPEIIYSRENSSNIFGASCSSDMCSIRATHSPRYIDVPLFQGFDLDPGFDYIARITPSVNRRDPRLWLKRSRVAYEREFGVKLDFVYALVSEYGFQSCRPHYHCLFMGLTEQQVYYLCERWQSEFGFAQAKFVPLRNIDGSDGFALASRYVSKYVTKGRFECQSVTDGACERPRICQSKGIGAGIIEKIKPFVYCFDMFGEYDPDKPELKLSSEQIKFVVAEIPKRLHFSPDGKFYYPIPRIFIDKLFKEKIVIKDEKFKKKNRVVMRPFKIWSMVTDNLFQLNVDLYQREFRQFQAGNGIGKISEALIAFRLYKEKTAAFSDEVGSKKILSIYQRSKF